MEMNTVMALFFMIIARKIVYNNETPGSHLVLTLNKLCVMPGEKEPCFREEYTSLSNEETWANIESAARKICGKRTACDLEELGRLCCLSPFLPNFSHEWCRDM
ncbi:hypothetical protein L596_000395 [Steinernema carpocapsae]|uniref:Uncharacterized protein n=1 Tax=Steinernema carpocapsae TaxID=34508 RepID=A0A4U8UKE7_STECR|nr:hypothetical protein L596_000395 [Steinernema carpocapsae]